MSEWDHIVGHDWAVATLQTAIEYGRVGHAYLITGPAQVGKTTLARTFAQALNCTEPEASQRPCGHCRACQLIATDRHPDVRLARGEVSGRGKTTLKIDQIRELQQELNLAAYEAHWKVAILRQFETATPGAANAFLKTLEEPPAGVVLLLTAADADTLLPTIRSRCRIITLRPLSVELVERSLAGRWHVPPDKAHLLAHLSGGRLGWAVQAAADPSLLETRAAHLAALQTALRGRRVARFSLAAKLAEDAEALPPVLQTWQSWWRDLALLVQGEGGSLTNVDQQAELEELAYRWRPEQVLASLKQTREALGQLERNANTRLVMECLFLFYPY